MRPGTARTKREITILLSILALSAIVSGAFIGALIWCCIQHPTIGYTAIAATVGLMALVKLQLRGGDAYLIDHPEYKGVKLYDGYDYGFTQTEGDCND